MIYSFDSHQGFSNIDRLPDNRTEEERLDTLLSIYNHNSPDISYAERLAEEISFISGAWITVFKRNRNAGNKDEVWDEDADPTYKKGIKLKGRFAPAPAEITLTKFGVDIENNVTIHFSRATVLQEFGKEMIAEGDVLIVPHNTLSVAQSTDLRDGPLNRIDTFRVLKSTDVANFKYRWLFWSVVAQSILGDASIQVDFRKEVS